MSQTPTDTAVSVRGVVKRYRDNTAVDDVSFDLERGAVTGLLGRNGAGKTTLLRLITGHDHVSAGEISVFGEAPYENDAVLHRVCFVGEHQTYPEGFKVDDVVAAGRIAFPNWDDTLADTLLEAFALPRRRQVRKLSRGMRSAVGITLAVASRAPLTLLDEPYLGLDAVARRTFYDHLLADFAEHPRTVVLSTHLIDEVSDLLQRVVLIDRGRVLLDDDAEALRGSAVQVSGPAAVVEGFAAGHDTIRLQRVGSLGRATVRGVPARSRELATGRGLTIEPVTLQDLIVDLTVQEDLNHKLSVGESMPRNGVGTKEAAR
jgi:ABC-2 type transport system ATP-binding protein